MPITYAQQPELAAGDLDRRVTLLMPIYNPAGDEITEWAAIADVWASISPNFALEVNESGRYVEIITVPIVIRYRGDVDARWRLAYSEPGWVHTYEIEGIVNPVKRRAALQLNCKEVL
jgi:SPP1 family predicted phage head-tail adaptor